MSQLVCRLTEIDETTIERALIALREKERQQYHYESAAVEAQIASVRRALEAADRA